MKDCIIHVVWYQVPSTKYQVFVEAVQSRIVYVLLTGYKVMLHN